jgi:hypothetical protein
MPFALIPISARSPVRSSMPVMRMEDREPPAIQPGQAALPKGGPDRTRRRCLTNELNPGRPLQKLFVGVAFILLICSAQSSARAAEALDIRLPPLAQLDPPAPAVVSGPPPEQASGGGIITRLEAVIATLDAYAASARATQPSWSTPLTTTTGLLERRFRWDFDEQHSGNGTNTSVLDGNKTVEMIVTPTTEIQVGPPPYYIRSGVAGTGRTNRGAIESLAGFNDWPFFRVKQRLLSSPQSEDNYVLSALFQIQAPAGIQRLTNNSWEYIPSLAGGKGWGNFDIQAIVSTPLPASHRNIIGYQIQTNVAFQYRVQKLVPELEVNWTYYATGQRGGLNQVFLTPGVLFGRFKLSDATYLTAGVGYQIAVSPDYRPKPLTPAYDHAWVITTRIGF